MTSYSHRSGRWWHQGKPGNLPYLLRPLLLLFACLSAACAQSLPERVQQTPSTVELQVDSQSHRLTTESSTVRELLDEAGITLGSSDEVVPPLFTPMQNDLVITVVRVSEKTESILQAIPFERKIVRNESMDADAAPVILQAGQAGLQEETVRVVYRDGVESERWVTQVTTLEAAKDEILMIGIGSARGNVVFDGILAYISDGTSIILRGLTGFPEQLNTGAGLDGRVFSLSPTGSHLLFTKSLSDTNSFNNSLWLVGTERGATPRQLGAENVLWADWNPNQTFPLQVAYSTANSTGLPPGWEANNDLWIIDLPTDEEADLQPEQLVESYPATYGWWGGNYAWSPTGRYIAYSYANEVGVIDMLESEGTRHRQLQRFTEYNTLLDWVWVPTLSWSPNGRFLVFTAHAGDDPEAMAFDSWVTDVSSGLSARLVQQTGMWGHMHWTIADEPGRDDTPTDSKIAFLKSNEPLNSLRSSYSLWLMDQDGSNARQVYPPPGENSHFPRERQFMAWGPGGDEIAFVFDNDLYLLNLATEETRRITQDDAISGHPAWAPYGAGLRPGLEPTRPRPPATPEGDEIEREFDSIAR